MKEKFKIVGIIALAAIFALSFVSCDLDDDPCKDGHTFGDWEFDGDKSATRECTECGEIEDLTKEHFYGDWKITIESGSTHTVALSAGQFKLSTTNGTDHFTIASAVWAAEANSGSLTGAPSKDNYPVGFGITGTATTSGTTWAGNTTAGVYINKAGNKIVCRLTGVYGVREYTLTPAAAAE